VFVALYSRTLDKKIGDKKYVVHLSATHLSVIHPSSLIAYPLFLMTASRLCDFA
jgi:hypothetical protein